MEIPNLILRCKSKVGMKGLSGYLKKYEKSIWEMLHSSAGVKDSGHLSRVENSVHK